MEVILSGVTKIWGAEDAAGRVVALREITHRFAGQAFSCVLGPSGCGKSTLLQIVAGLVEPTSGRVTVRDPADGAEPDPLGAHSVMVWQNFNLFPWRNVIDNVAFGLEMRGMSRRARYEEARRYIQLVHLQGFENKYPWQLSGGMKQRVGLARALIMDPKILLMDEPFGSLDAQTKIVLQDELLKLFEETRKTVLFVTHSIDEAILLGDEVMVMTARPGRVKEIVPVPLPRPRTLEILHSAEFGRIYDHIFGLIREEVMKSMWEETGA